MIAHSLCDFGQSTGALLLFCSHNSSPDLEELSSKKTHSQSFLIFIQNLTKSASTFSMKKVSKVGFPDLFSWSNKTQLHFHFYLVTLLFCIQKQNLKATLISFLQ